MDPLVQQHHQRNETNYNQQNYSQNDLLHNMNSLSLNNTPSAGATYLATSTPIITPPKANRLPRPKSSATTAIAISSSSSDDKESWKTSGNNASPNSKNKKETESWKMSTKPRHAQLTSVSSSGDDRRHSAPVASIPPPFPKPLPQEPYVYSTPMIQQHPVDYTNYTPYMDQQQPQPFHIAIQPRSNYPSVYNEPYPPPSIHQQPYPNYPPQQQDYQTPPFIQHNEYHAYNNEAAYNVDYHQQPTYTNPPPPTLTMNNEYPSQQPIEHQGTILSDPPVNISTTPAVTSTEEKKKKDSKDSTTTAKPEKKVRQITVQSINMEHRVWIDVLPSETGLSLAEKIHIIATFRTRKIVSITTASGRKIPLDNRPVFGSWMDMESFEDGERWIVEWRENDRGVVDKFMSKIIQASSGKRNKDHVT